ncbi:MAG: deoxyribonuclease IV [Tractidigestivibacter sp.]|jgi:deoxyribonuclease-4|uniref:deoxyribonuclease IV n=1 Tax=Tractidigestivibacter sp. TaxID=2847320 RepID=UPI003D8B9812
MGGDSQTKGTSAQPVRGPLTIGPHISASGGWKAMGERALSIGATTFAFFTRNPHRGSTLKSLDETDPAELAQLMEDNGFGTLVAHAPYTMNLCSAKPDIVEFGRQMMAEDIARLDEAIPGSYYNFHPGSHVKQGADEGIRLICEGLDQVLVPGQKTRVLLETMAGKGSEVGRTFEELERIIEGTKHGDMLGVCLDTCHVWDGGYDIVGDLDGVLDEFDRVIGLDRLCALHVNDSKNPRGSHKDRHEKIGQGEIGLEGFRGIVANERLRGLPMILETPNELEGFGAEIQLLQSMASEGARA